MLLRSSYILFFLLLVSFSITGGRKLEKAFHALEIYDYFSAKELFTKSLKKHECAASYGLSQIFYSDKNPFSNIDSARIYALKSSHAWIESNEKERLELNNFTVDSNSIVSLMNDIAVRALIYHQEQNTIDDYEYFIVNYDYSKLKNEAIRLRDELIYEDVLLINSAAAYKEFIEFYPLAVQFDDARYNYDLRVFEESTSLSKIEDIEQFIKNFPNSPYLSQAQDKLYNLSTANGKLRSYKNFIEKYPSNPNVETCWEKIYEIETEKMSPEVLADFLIEYPHYPDRYLVIDELANLLKILIPARLNGSWGFIDTAGTWVIRPIFDSCEPFKEGMSLISENDKFGFINTRGKRVILPEYEDAESFNNGYAVVYNGQKYGALNRFGDVIIDAAYDDIGEFVNGVAYASKNDKYGYIDENGYVLIPYIYDQAFSFDKGKTLVKQNGKFGIINKENKRLLPFNYDWIEPHFQDSLIKVKQGGFFGLINFDLDTILPIKYKHIGRIDQNLILVVENNKVGYINSKGDWIIPMIYESDPFILDWGEYENGSVRIRVKGKMGIIDTTGKRIGPAIFQEIGEYDGILYPVKKNGKWGYADENIKLVIGYKYEKVFPFEGDIARVRKKSKWGMIDRSGVVSIPIEYSRIIPSGGVFIMENDTAYGMLDYYGNTILDPVFDQIKYNPLGFYTLFLNGKYAYLDIERRKVFWKEEGFSTP